MKINEKNLSAFASSATPVDREGWLDMRGEVKSYQRRWFTLKGNLLFYFDKKGDKEPAGVIVLEGCTIGNKFFIHFENRMVQYAIFLSLVKDGLYKLK